MFNKILVPLDGSPLAEQALEKAVNIAQANDASLCLARIVVPLEIVAPFVEVQHVYDDAVHRQKEEAQAYLDEVAERLQGRLSKPVHTEARLGMVAETILDCAQENGVDLIVMCSHGRTGFSRWVYGSIAEKVLRGAHCDTLIVRGKFAE
jgi:nucleotide-binding universal stress UspA family protein